MVTGIWYAAVVAIITDGAEAAVITMDGHAADTADGVNSDIEAASITGRLGSRGTPAPAIARARVPQPLPHRDAADRGSAGSLCELSLQC